MSSFDQAVLTIIQHETLPPHTDGSFTVTSGDRGGATKWGVSLRFFQEEFPALGVTLSFPVPASADDIKALTRDQACQVYRVCWWDRYGYGRLVDQNVATKVFDMAVNMRRQAAHRIVQEAIAACGVRLLVDGIFGNDTIRAANGVNPKNLLFAMTVKQAAHYQSICTADPTQEKFRNGWMARAAWPFPARASIIA